MAIKIKYQYKVYDGCEEATKKSKSWERSKALGWSIWICLGFATLSGSNAISQLITSRYDTETFWPMILFFVIAISIAYSYVFRSKYVYPTCEELFLETKKTKENQKLIDEKIQSISKKKWIDVKRALIKFSVIYFSVFAALIVLYSINI